MAQVTPVADDLEQDKGGPPVPESVLRSRSAPAVGKTKLRKARTQVALEKAQKVQDHSGDKVDADIDLWVRLKLREWDKDQDGTFTLEEMEVAIEELHETEGELANMKWRFIIMFSFILVFVLFLGGTAAVGMALTKTTEVPDSGEMRAINKNSKKPGLTELVTTTESRGTMSMLTMLDFDNTTDQWTIDESQLREMDKVSFLDSKKTYYNFDVAELLRIDSGKSGTNDKLEIMTTSGTQLRIWESIGDLEVKWPSSSMWEVLERDNSTNSGRLLSDEDVLTPAFAEEQHMLGEDTQDSETPLSRRLGKGGVRIAYVGVHHRSHGGGGDSCSRHGWCNVPFGTAEGCGSYCQELQCYNWGRDTYQCNAARTSFGPHLLLQALAAALIITKTSLLD